MKPKAVRRLSYDDQKVRLKDFLANFEEYDSEQAYGVHGRKKYKNNMQNVADEDTKTVQILIQDLESYFRKDDEKQMVEQIKSNTMRYILLFSEAIDEMMPPRAKPISPEDDIRIRFENILNEQRRDNMESQNNAMAAEGELIPLATRKNFDVSILYGPGSKIKVRSISELTSDLIGSLVVCRAIVVRVSEVKPEIMVATYACDICGCENYLQVLDSSYRPLDRCISKKCVENKVSGKLTFLAGHSKFRPVQQLKIQETPDQLNKGSIPRTFTMHLKNSHVKSASPGDIIQIQGILFPHRRPGYRYQHELAFDSHLEALKVTREKKKYIDMAMSQSEIDFIYQTRGSMEESVLFNKLAASIAPEIYGLATVKKALLLLMVGGITQQTHDNLRIRGEINIALIGDPGIAKSQLLKHISYIAPRAIYTTGKGSSGVGLTAAVVIDPQTKEICLQAGALVLADMGVCCIDQFDKMDQYDRTAIHEVMQQQTVSIAKAGITTTLNARTSILAAANPLYGRYNKKESRHKNVNLPAALLSRFDLVFILLDECNASIDTELGLHIGYVHMTKQAPIRNVFDQSFIRSYIALAKQFTPTISEELHHLLINKYIEKRGEQTSAIKQGESYVTPRSLLALIRLCQARARLRFSNQVSYADVAECMQIQEECYKSFFDNEERKVVLDFTAGIYEIIKDLCCCRADRSIHQDQLLKKVIGRGYTEEQMRVAISEYNNIGVLMVDGPIIIVIEKDL